MNDHVDRAAEVVCPTCAMRIDPNERCLAELGMGRCMERQGHEGWHWSDFGRGGITRWTGHYVEHNACPGRITLLEWCQLPVGHEGGHNNGRGATFWPVEEAS